MILNLINRNVNNVYFRKNQAYDKRIRLFLSFSSMECDDSKKSFKISQGQYCNET